MRSSLRAVARGPLDHAPKAIDVGDECWPVNRRPISLIFGCVHIACAPDLGSQMGLVFGTATILNFNVSMVTAPRRRMHPAGALAPPRRLRLNLFPQRKICGNGMVAIGSRAASGPTGIGRASINQACREDGR